MRSLFGFSRCLSIGALLCMLSCAGSPPHRTGIGAAAFEGELVVTGDMPEERRITLAGEKGAVWRLESPRLEGELLNLAGQRLRVWGVFREKDEPGEGMSILVSRYELLPIEGSAPIIGTLVADGLQVFLSARESHERYLLTGPLSDALKCYIGCRAWVWGVPSGERNGGGEASLDVRGYGILGPGATPPAPPDTLDSSGSR